ncbi:MULTISPECIES: MarR family winged helix-turn-helix transcriptional regulator [Agromyces]|uniref:MarR family winged helix-turn-helix transcriptional regulator n=1 Tax=Agromyces TaxID=33877 RepID=UPI001E53CBB8|nr:MULTISPECIES: MarR family winged helix-turn-helix transcriptional regulator [Agromyces]MCD1572498.1 MarR family winged helix-turn-helix transcriptional regulator [Agromyces mediolanus]
MNALLGDRLTVTLHHLSTLMQQFGDRFLRERFGVSHAQFVFIATLATIAPPPDITTLAECLGITKAAVSKRVPGLVEAGLVTTSTDAANARRVLLEPTPAALQLIERAGPALDAAFSGLLAGVDGVELGSLHRDLALLVAHLERAGA